MATLLNLSNPGRTAPLATDVEATSVCRQVVFIDPTVADYKSLLAGIAPGTEVYLLDPHKDRLSQIARALRGQTGITSVSIIAHGEEGAIRLGSTIVDAAVVAHSHAALATIGASLAPGGDILLYGCDTGEGTDGQALVDQIASATGAKVAAASHLVGDTSTGENWNLDVTSTGSALDAPQVLSTAAENAYTHTLVINDPPSGRRQLTRPASPSTRTRFLRAPASRYSSPIIRVAARARTASSSSC